MILLGYQVDTRANWPTAFNFDAMVALKSIPLRYSAVDHHTTQLEMRRAE